MKHLPILVMVLVICTMQIPAPAADKPPGLPIEEALKIAQNYLKSINSAEPRFLAGVTLENPAVRGAQYWYAQWSSPIFGGAKPELGLRIDMDGSLTKVVSGGAVPGVGSQRFGARNIR